jgi:hypothetical protein
LSACQGLCIDVRGQEGRQGVRFRHKRPPLTPYRRCPLHHSTGSKRAWGWGCRRLRRSGPSPLVCTTPRMSEVKSVQAPTSARSGTTPTCATASRAFLSPPVISPGPHRPANDTWTTGRGGRGNFCRLWRCSSLSRMSTVRGFGEFYTFSPPRQRSTARSTVTRHALGIYISKSEPRNAVLGRLLWLNFATFALGDDGLNGSRLPEDEHPHEHPHHLDSGPRLRRFRPGRCRGVVAVGSEACH